MPQVKTEKISLHGLGTGLRGEFIIKYRFNPKSNYHSNPQFEADWPPEIAAALKESYARGDTFDEVRRNFFAGIEKYKTFETSKTRVILYSISTSNQYNRSCRCNPLQLHKS